MDIAKKILKFNRGDFAMLNVLKNNTVSIYNSGCCGMAGSLVMKKNIMRLVCRWERILFQK
jgi:hypothetical protein